jgi:hypothetical protein
MIHEGVSLRMGGPAVEVQETDAWKVIAVLSRIKKGDPLQASSEQVYRANRAYWVDGDYAATVGAAFSACEVLLNSVLLMMAWEEGTGRDIPRGWFEEQGLVRRLRTHYHNRLGGSWDPNNPNRIIGRVMALAELRGRVVHAGYWPTEREAAGAREVMGDLSDFVKGRLIASFDRYPRTALLLLGEPGFRRLGKWEEADRFMREQGALEEPWLASYREWLDAAPPPRAGEGG